MADYSAWLEDVEEEGGSNEADQAEVREERSFVSRKLAEEKEQEHKRKNKSTWGAYYPGGGTASWSDGKHSEFFGYKDHKKTGGVYSDHGHQSQAYEYEDDWDNDPYDFYRSSNFYRFGFGGRGGGTSARRGSSGGEERSKGPSSSTGSSSNQNQQQYQQQNGHQDSSNSLGDKQVERCYYSVLGIERSATQSDIKRAYHSLALQFHPDKNPTDVAGMKFREISAAYEIIGDVSCR